MFPKKPFLHVHANSVNFALMNDSENWQHTIPHLTTDLPFFLITENIHQSIYSARTHSENGQTRIDFWKPSFIQPEPIGAPSHLFFLTQAILRPKIKMCKVTDYTKIILKVPNTPRSPHGLFDGSVSCSAVKGKYRMWLEHTPVVRHLSA